MVVLRQFPALDWIPNVISYVEEMFIRDDVGNDVCCCKCIFPVSFKDGSCSIDGALVDRDCVIIVSDRHRNSWLDSLTICHCP